MNIEQLIEWCNSNYFNLENQAGDRLDVIDYEEIIAYLLKTKMEQKKMKTVAKSNVIDFIDNVNNGIYCQNLIIKTNLSTFVWKNEQKGVITCKGQVITEDELLETVAEIERFEVGEIITFPAVLLPPKKSKSKNKQQIEKEQRANKIMFLAVLAQSTIDNMEEDIGEFKFKHKKLAKNFLEETLKIMDQDFQNGKAVDQLVNLSVWIQDVYNVMIEVGKRTPLDQKCFQTDWEALLIKYKLDK